MEILCMGVEGVGHETAHRGGGIIVGAEKIPHVNQQAEIRVVDGRHQLLDPHAVLAEESVIFDHGADSFFGGVAGHLAAAFSQAGQGGVKALGTNMIVRPSGRGIVTHAGNTEDLGDIDFVLYPFDLGLQVAA
jgi:hypothetical protein